MSLFAPALDISVYVTSIKNGATGAPIAAAVRRTFDSVVSVISKLNALFSVDQKGNVSVDSINIRSLTKRFTYEDPPDAQNVASAGYRIIPLGDWVRLRNTSGGVLTLTSVPTIPLGANGQVIELMNISSNSITLQRHDTLAGSLLYMDATTKILAQAQTIKFRCSTDIGGWLQIAYTAAA